MFADRMRSSVDSLANPNNKNDFARCKVSSLQRRRRRQKLARVTNMQWRAQTSDINLQSFRPAGPPPPAFHPRPRRSPVLPTSEANVFTVKSRCLDRQMKPRYICARLQMLLLPLIWIEEEEPFSHRHGLKKRTRGETLWLHATIWAQDWS